MVNCLQVWVLSTLNVAKGVAEVSSRVNRLKSSVLRQIQITTPWFGIYVVMFFNSDHTHIAKVNDNVDHKSERVKPKLQLIKSR